MASDPSNSPFVGLRPFGELDAEFFFGREREIRIIAANVLSEPITVLYGASGVGKSSLLQAGVIPELKREEETSRAIYFREWNDQSNVDALLPQIARLAEPQSRSGAVGGQGIGRRFLLLDQFEEYLLYYHDSALSDAIDAALARLVNRAEVASNVLIGIREDSLAELDQRFGLRIPGLLNNTLPVQHLSVPSARMAIEGPLARLSERTGEQYSIEPRLVDEILKAASTSLQSTSAVGVAALPAGDGEARVEPVYLQLVLKRLWNEEFKTRLDAEKRQPPWTLHAQTLHHIGGADRIVESHVNDVMEGLKTGKRCDIAARLFPHLVTPSRRKIAQSTRDLIEFAAAPEPEVRAVLDHLSAGDEARILRRLVAPDMYELFHDVLAQPVLAWRRRHLSETDRRRLIRNWIQYTAIAVVVIAVGVSAWLFVRRQAEKEKLASARAQAAAEALKAEAQAERKNAEADAAKARGDLQSYKMLLEQAKQDQTTAQQAQSTASVLNSPGLSKWSITDMANRQGSLLQQNTNLQAQLDADRKEIEQLKKAAHSNPAPQGTKPDGGTTTSIPAGSAETHSIPGASSGGGGSPAGNSSEQRGVSSAPTSSTTFIPNDSALRDAHSGLTLLLKHMGFAPITAKLYVLLPKPGTEFEAVRYTKDKKKAEMYADKFKAALPQCDGRHATISGAEVWCFQIVESSIKRDKPQYLGRVTVNGKNEELRATKFSYEEPSITIEIRDAD